MAFCSRNCAPSRDAWSGSHMPLVPLSLRMSCVCEGKKAKFKSRLSLMQVAFDTIYF